MKLQRYGGILDEWKCDMGEAVRRRKYLFGIAFFWTLKFTDTFASTCRRSNLRLIQHRRKCWYFFKYFTSRSFENCLFFKDKILFSLFPEKTTNPFTFTTRTYTVAIRIKRASNRLPFSPKLHFQVLPFYQIPVTTRLSPSFHPPPCPGYFLITSIRTISMRRSPDTRRTRAERERERERFNQLTI